MSGGPRSVAVYLVVRETPGPEAVARLAAAIAASGAQSVLIEPQGAAFQPAVAKPLIESVQAKGVAALLSGDALMARTLRADGVHLPWSKDPIAAYGAAREILGNRYIVGADAGRSRHDAMSLGEAGADYVGFGIPAHVEDRETARERQIDLVAWWSELFEVPCVALDAADADLALLTEAGADFIALSVDLAETEAEIVAGLSRRCALLRHTVEV